MLINKEIIECELEYTKCFSRFYENEDIVRFHDDELKDMYDHNYTYLKKAMSEIKLKEVLNNEISLRLSEKGSFCNIILNFEINNTIFSMLEFSPEISTNGYYIFDISKFSKLKSVPGCIIQKVSNQEMVEDVLFCNLKHAEEVLGKDFCTKKCYRRGKIYIADEGIDSYICYHNGEIIGNCDLFIFNGVAKIEDFAVIPLYQRRGYGTTILKALIDVAIKQDCHTIYLVADEDDTAKEMYEKISFKKVGERTDLFFELY